MTLAATGVLIIAGSLLFSHRILYALGAVLNRDEPPQKVDLIVVLGGDWRGSRILTAARLAQQGYAPKVLVSGGGELYGFHESDVAIDFAVRRGYPRDLFIPFRYPGLSTKEEADADAAEMRRRGVHRYILVTSIYHTARAARIFQREAGDLEIHPVSAPDRYWRDGEWWKYREGRKIWLTEIMKTFADYFGI